MLFHNFIFIPEAVPYLYPDQNSVYAIFYSVKVTFKNLISITKLLDNFTLFTYISQVIVCVLAA